MPTNLTLGFPEPQQERLLLRRSGLEGAIARFERALQEPESPVRAVRRIAAREADLVIAVGARLGEMTTSGYTLLNVPVPSQSLVHVHAGAEELGRVYQSQLMINAGMSQFASRLAMMVLTSRGTSPP